MQKLNLPTISSVVEPLFPPSSDLSTISSIVGLLRRSFVIQSTNAEVELLALESNFYFSRRFVI